MMRERLDGGVQQALGGGYAMGGPRTEGCARSRVFFQVITATLLLAASCGGEAQDTGGLGGEVTSCSACGEDEACYVLSHPEMKCCNPNQAERISWSGGSVTSCVWSCSYFEGARQYVQLSFHDFDADGIWNVDEDFVGSCRSGR